MSNQVRIGVIGTSWWSELVYLPILQQDEWADLVAVCGRNMERTREVASKYDIPQTYGDYKQMFALANLDAVVVATPDDTHYTMVMDALDANLHVLCEKPIALNAEDALKMLNRANQVGVKHMVMYTHHWMPYLQRMRELLKRGYLGKVYHGYMHWFASYARGEDYMWRFDAERANGILGDLGSHMIHLFMWLLGDVKAVSGKLSVNDSHQPFPANDTAQFIVEFHNGATIQFYTSATAYVDGSTRLSLELYGEEGLISAGWFRNEGKGVTWLTGQRLDASEDIHEAKELDMGDYLSRNPVGVRMFVARIVEDRPINPSLKEGYKVQRVIDAIIEADRIGDRVVL